MIPSDNLQAQALEAADFLNSQGYSWDEIADIAGISPRGLRRFRAGERSASTNVVRNLIRAVEGPNVTVVIGSEAL